MDDTQQAAQPTMDPQPTDTTVSSMSDVAGMTPPPAPVMPEVTMPSEPVMPTMAEPAPTAAPAMEESGAPAGGEEDYSSAEDVLNEILDSLDRIEAKLEAMEKKMG